MVKWIRIVSGVMMMGTLSACSSVSGSDFRGASALAMWGGGVGMLSGCDQPCEAITGAGFIGSVIGGVFAQ